MPCTLSQMMANRLNALRSTGPKSDEGKARSSQNARSHGLSRAVGDAAPLAWDSLIASRKTNWRGSYRPMDDAQEYHFNRLVAESVRLDQCEGRIQIARIEFADRAVETWDDDRRAEVNGLAAHLAKNPENIQSLLLQSKHGVQWLLDAWQEVAESLRYHDHWTGPNWQRAMDLLGLSTHARGSSTPHDLHPEDVSPGLGLAFIHEVMDALRSRLSDALDDRDSRARRDAKLGIEISDPKPIRLLERYAADARRRVRWSIAELLRLQSAASAPQAEHSSPAETPSSGPPGPRPDRRKLMQERRLSMAESPERIEPNPTESPARNEPIVTDSPDRIELLDQEPPARNEPISTESTPSSRPRPTLQPTSASPILQNRRARRAEAAAARRRS